MFFTLTKIEIVVAQSNFWQQTNGPYGGSVSALSINASGYVFAVIGSPGFSNSDNGVFLSTDSGNTWKGTSLSHTHTQALSIGPSGYLYAGTDAAGVFRSTNNGVSWDSINTGLTTRYITCLAIKSADTIFAGTTIGVFRSTDNGGSWNSMNTGLTNRIVLTLVVSPSNRHIFAGSWGGISRSSDNGNNWTQVFVLPSYDAAWRLAINSLGHIFASTEGGVIRSTDNCNSWTQVGRGSPRFVHAFAINSSDHVFTGTSNGVFRSTNNGDGWVQTSGLLR